VTPESTRPRGTVAAVVQGRMTSTRLPGKVLADIGGQPSLRLQLARLRRATELDAIVVATSVDPSDDAIVELCGDMGIAVVRGPLLDVLERYRLAGEQLGAEGIVRLTADCPFIDPAVVDRVVARWRAGSEDFVGNCVDPRTYPVGMDTEVVTWAALRAAAAEAIDPIDREHVTPFVRSRPQRFPAARVDLDPAYANVRLTLDTPEDLALLRDVATRVPADAGLADILRALGAQPDPA
jgi:spore coat polysaccharide biosynthesis protein SpsF (cytidylyltransferase family)